MQKYKNLILLAGLILVMLIGSIVFLAPKISSFVVLLKDLSTKKIAVTTLDKKLMTLEENQRKINEKSKDITIKTIYKIENNDTEGAFAFLLDSIIDFAKFNGVKISSIEYEYNPVNEENLSEKSGSKISVCLLKLKLIADYADLNDFLKAIWKYPYLINVSSLEIEPYNKNKSILLANLNLALLITK